MGLSLWKKAYILRRFRDSVASGGYMTSEYDDMTIKADVQTTDRSVSTDSDGDYALQHLKVFSDMEILVANEDKKTMADKLWFQGKWFECRSSRLSNNTFLAHWTSTFVQCLHQDPPPGSEVSG